jgi:hypothetical protein
VTVIGASRVSREEFLEFSGQAVARRMRLVAQVMQ